MTLRVFHGAMRETRSRHGRSAGAAMQVRTLGQAQLSAGRTRIGPEAPVAFPLMLQLVLERDRWIARTQLQDMLFPGQDANNAAHSLRQSVYKLRQQGFPIEGSGPALHIPAAAIEDDYSTLLAPQLEPPRDLSGVLGGWLTGFVPSVSPAYSHWFEEKRAEIGLQMRRALLAELAVHKRYGRWQQCERTCRAVLMLDQLNEEATLGLAEALALTGSKAEAVRLLDRYQEEVPNTDLHLPAKILRRRISERTPERPAERRQPIFVGREKEMEQITQALETALSGVPTGVIVHGEPGIGKTRLLQEASNGAVINGFRVASHVCRPHDVRRPLGVFTGLVPQLRAMPGALGCAPEALELLSRLEGVGGWVRGPVMATVDVDHLSALICAAMEELTAAVASETALVLRVDDVHWADEASLFLLARLSRLLDARMAILVGGRSVPRVIRGEHGTAFLDVSVFALSEVHAHSLFLDEFSSPIEEASMQWGKTLAAGNPLFLLTLARHLSDQPDNRELPTELLHLLEDRLGTLSSEDSQVFAAVCLLGRHARYSVIEQIVGSSRFSLLESFRRLEKGGFISLHEDRLEPAHPLFAEVAQRGIGVAASKYLCHTAAEVLHARSRATADASILWDVVHLTRLSGGVETAIKTAQECAQQALALGCAGDACDLLAEALESAKDPGLRAVLLAELLGASRSCSRWQVVKDCIAAIRHAAVDTTPMSKAELDCSSIEAEWHTRHSHEEVAARLVELCNSPDLSKSSRLRSADLLEICAVNLHDRDLATTARAVADQQIAAGSTDPHCLCLLLIYEASFGDMDLTEKYSRDLRDILRTLPTSVQTLRLRSNAAIGLRVAGCFEEAIHDLKALYIEASRLKYPVQAYRAAHEICYGLIAIGELDGAIKWFRAAEELVPTALPHIDHCEHIEAQVWIELLTGEPSNAVPLARDVVTFSTTRSPRLRSSAAVLYLLSRVLAGPVANAAALAAELIPEYLRHRGVLGSDLYTLSACMLLSACGETLQAQRLASEYALIRRERYPLGGALRQFAYPNVSPA